MTARRILVVEDDPSVRGLLETLLTAEGYQVSTASDGLGGLVKMANSRPDLVLLDLMMPDLGGVRVLEEVFADPALTGIPFIVVTGKADAVASMQDLLGEDNVFLKPFAVSKLLSRVSGVTGGPHGSSRP